MTTMEAKDALAAAVYPDVQTGAANDANLLSGAREGDWARWTAIIDESLVEWGRNPSQFADDDLVPPSPQALRMACNTAVELRKQGCEPPTRVVPDGEGGLSFERSDGPWFASVNVESDGTIEIVTFLDCKLVSRERIP